MFALFSDYQKRRHADSEMSQMTREDFDAMLSEGAADTRVFQLRTEGEGNELRGAVIADRLSDGYSAVYSFFSPMEKRKSLGTQLVLTLIDQAVSEGLPFVYLGYWIKSSRKMSYKTRFRPLQRLGINGWEDFCREEEI
jgi:arginine-tRNA-protein transferase